MQKQAVQLALESIREARGQWAKAQTEFNAGLAASMRFLLFESARNYMAPEEVSRHSGLTVKRVRALMREYGLNPRDGKRVLSASAARALTENAELLGIDPSEMDLTSPLAYLPMGKHLRDTLREQTISRVIELPDIAEAREALDRLFDQAVNTAGRDGVARVTEDYASVLEALGES